jgi:16S rRNA (guanine1207-N2)-methyltransferase
VAGIVAALRSPEAHVTLLDSFARAVQCAEANIQAHGLNDRCRTVLSAHAERDLDPGYDLVLTNPPYFGDYRISERFLDAARTLLVPGGRVSLVTKGLEWHRAQMQDLFGNATVEKRGGYAILTSQQPGADA